MKVAVIGSGISGLTAAHVIARRGNEVTLYEKDGHFGGHSNTVTVAGERGEIGVDTGFIVHNQRTYPHLIRLFDELGVATQESDMSFGVRCDDCGLEYAGARGVRGMLATPGSLTKPSYLRMLTEVRRFHRHARRVLLDPAADRMSLGDVPRRRRILRLLPRPLRAPADRRDLVVLTHPDVRVPGPLPDPLLRQPRHADRDATRRSWRTVDRRQPRLRAGRSSGGWAPARWARLRRCPCSGRRTASSSATPTARERRFDGVVIATHADQALRAARPTRRRRSGTVLCAFRYSANETVLHTDGSILPRASAARAPPGTTCSRPVPRRQPHGACDLPHEPPAGP